MKPLNIKRPKNKTKKRTKKRIKKENLRNQNIKELIFLKEAHLVTALSTYSLQIICQEDINSKILSLTKT